MTVKNVGGSPTWAVCRGLTIIGSGGSVLWAPAFEVPALGPGQEHVLGEQVPWGIAPWVAGTYTVDVAVDTGSAVAESDETKDEATVTFTASP